MKRKTQGLGKVMLGLVIVLALFACKEETGEVNDKVATEDLVTLDLNQVIERHDETQVRIAYAGFEGVNIRLDKQVVDRVKAGDTIEYTGQVTLDSEVWLTLERDGLVHYVAKRFTRDDQRHYRLYQGDEFQGYYGQGDFQVLDQAMALAVVDYRLAKVSEVILDGKAMQAYDLVMAPSMALEADMVLHYKTYEVLCSAAETRTIYVTRDGDFKVLHQLDPLAVDHQILLLEDIAIDVGLAYVHHEESQSLLYIDPLDDHKINIYHRPSGQGYAIAYDYGLEELNLQDAEILVNGQGKEDHLILEGDHWVSTVKGEPDLFYFDDKVLKPLYMPRKDLETGQATDIFLLEGGKLIRLYSTQDRANTYYRKVLCENQSYMALETGVHQVYIKDEVVNLMDKSFIKQEVLEGGLLLTFKGHDNALTHYMINKTGDVTAMHNTLEFSKNRKYFFEADVDSQGAYALAVYDASTLKVIHNFDDFLWPRAQDVLDEVWKDNKIIFEVFKTQVDGWLNMTDNQAWYEEYFDPKSMAEDVGMAGSQTMVNLEFFDAVKGSSKGYKDVSIGGLFFSGHLSLEDGQVILWFSHDLHGYCKRPLRSYETINYGGLRPLTIVYDTNQSLVFDDGLRRHFSSEDLDGNELTLHTSDGTIQVVNLKTK